MIPAADRRRNVPHPIPMILPLAEIAQRLRNGAGQFLPHSRLQSLTLIMEDEINWMTVTRYDRGGEKRR